MKVWTSICLVLALGAAASAHATCSYPKAPGALPDGATATKEEMIAAKQDITRYNTEMNAYLDCLKLEGDAAKPKDPSKLTPEEKKKADEQQAILVQKNNSAVDELQAVVGKFNEQLRIFKARQK